MKARKPKVLVIVGPTASGKSGLGVELARKFNGEIISADSRQVYRGLDIGTGKVTKAEMKGVPHHLLDISSPKHVVTAHEFAAKARKAASQILARKKLPIVVGGTGFYIDALLGRMDLSDVPPDPALRQRLQEKTAAKLYALLKKQDPRRAKAMNTPSERNNKVRLIRAIEIAKSSRTSEKPTKVAFDALWVGIAPTQRELEQKIQRRLTARIRAGMIGEAMRLHANGLSYKRMQQLGLEYRSLARLLEKKITRKEFEQELFRDIRRYSKKQLMYWKRNKEVRWYDPKQKKRIEQAVASWLKIS